MKGSACGKNLMVCVGGMDTDLEDDCQVGFLKKWFRVGHQEEQKAQQCHGGGTDRDKWAVGPGLCVQSCPFSAGSQPATLWSFCPGQEQEKAQAEAALLLHRVP